MTPVALLGPQTPPPTQPSRIGADALPAAESAQSDFRTMLDAQVGEAKPEKPNPTAEGMQVANQMTSAPRDGSSQAQIVSASPILDVLKEIAKDESGAPRRHRKSASDQPDAVPSPIAPTPSASIPLLPVTLPAGLLSSGAMSPGKGQTRTLGSMTSPVEELRTLPKSHGPAPQPPAGSDAASSAPAAGTSSGLADETAKESVAIVGIRSTHALGSNREAPVETPSPRVSNVQMETHFPPAGPSFAPGSGEQTPQVQDASAISGTQEIAPAPAMQQANVLALDLGQGPGEPLHVRLRLTGDTLGVDLRAGPREVAQFDRDGLRKSLEAAGYSVDSLVVRVIPPADSAAPGLMQQQNGGASGALTTLPGSSDRGLQAQSQSFSGQGGGERRPSTQQGARHDFAAEKSDGAAPSRTSGALVV